MAQENFPILEADTRNPQSTPMVVLEIVYPSDSRRNSNSLSSYNEVLLAMAASCAINCNPPRSIDRGLEYFAPAS